MTATETSTFEQYLADVMGWHRPGFPALAKVALSRCREYREASTGRAEPMRHPFLSKDDLEQEVRIKLWRVWSKFSDSKPYQEVCALGNAMVARCVSGVLRRARPFGQPEVRAQARALAAGRPAEVPPKVVHLDAPIQSATAEGNCADTYDYFLRDRSAADALQRASAVQALEAFVSGLRGDERRIFGELVSMSARTLEAFERAAQVGGASAEAARIRAISQVLEVPVKVVKRVAARLEDAARNTDL
jgi:hypothetical protein